MLPVGILEIISLLTFRRDALVLDRFTCSSAPFETNVVLSDSNAYFKIDSGLAPLGLGASSNRLRDTRFHCPFLSMKTVSLLASLPDKGPQ